MGKKTVKTFTKELLQYPLIALDSSCFIYHIEENKRYVPFTQVLFETLMPEGDIETACATLVLTEVLTQPMVEKRQELVLVYKSLIVSFPHLTVVPLSSDIAEKGAYFRAKYHLRTPDAIHIATAYEVGAEAIVCNDAKWKRVKEMAIVDLDAFL